MRFSPCLSRNLGRRNTAKEHYCKKYSLGCSLHAGSLSPMVPKQRKIV
jgi:hypothetical protein